MKIISPEGPTDRPAIAIVGEFPVDKDLEENSPFASGGGWHLKNWLRQIGIEFEDCYRTYVFKETPPGNDLRYLCRPKKEVDTELKSTHPLGKKAKYPFEHLAKKGASKLYLPYDKAAQVRSEIMAEINSVKPNLVLSLGRAASWAFLNTPAIDSVRGRVAESTLIPGQKILPTYGPISVLRAYDYLPIFLADLDKALRQSVFPGVRIPSREIWINPTLSECWEFYNRYIALGSGPLSIDIETEREQVTCIGFAPDRYHSLVVPIWDKTKPNWSYWPTLQEEQQAWSFIRHVVSVKPTQIGSRLRPFLFQNGLYDLQFTLRAQGVSMVNPAEDTMLLHHALQPEMEKGLGFLASIHTDNPSWKGMYKEARAKESMKADD